MSILVKNNIHWVGQRDWEVRDFHGTEYKTLRGSSYNSYLIREGKNVLIDTVDHKFSREFVQNLRSEIDLADIDYIVINHAEEDHAGALTELMKRHPDAKVIMCSTLTQQNAEISMKAMDSADFKCAARATSRAVRSMPRPKGK